VKIIIFDDLIWRRQADYAVDGLEIVFYENADRALEIVAAEHPTVVLMDYAMGTRTSGAEAVRSLRTRYPRSALALVGISSDPRSNDQMLAAGADDALPKTHLKGYLSRLARSRTSR
jgi:CheY-like chemotaxis protein